MWEEVAYQLTKIYRWKWVGKTGLSWAVVTRGKSRGKRITAKLSQHNCTIKQMGTICIKSLNLSLKVEMDKIECRNSCIKGIKG